MDENPIQQPTQPVQPVIPEKPSLKFPLILLAVIGLTIAGYFASARFLNLWPFESYMSLPSPNLSDLANWETERNYNGFEFKYPKYLHVEDNYGYVVSLIDSSNGERMEPFIADIDTVHFRGQNLEQILDYWLHPPEFPNEPFPPHVLSKYLKTKVGGEPAYLLEYETSSVKSYNVIFLHGDKFFRVSANSEKELLILSTWKFIKPFPKPEYIYVHIRVRGPNGNEAVSMSPTTKVNAVDIFWDTEYTGNLNVYVEHLSQGKKFAIAEDRSISGEGGIGWAPDSLQNQGFLPGNDYVITVSSTDGHLSSSSHQFTITK